MSRYRVEWHRNVCNCATPMDWVVFDMERRAVLDHFKTRALARVVQSLARRARRLGYSIAPERTK